MHLLFRSEPPTLVRLGEYDLSADDDSDHEDVEISEIVHHPAYNGVQAYNDIALIRLNRSVTFGRFIKPACLWRQQTLPPGKLTAIGWGQLGYSEYCLIGYLERIVYVTTI